jgi:shikimate kinase
VEDVLLPTRHAVIDGDQIERLRTLLGVRSVVLIGMMGAGKTSIGRRLANILGLPFLDADAEIEKAANLTIPEIFEHYGETHFREGEKRVIARLLTEGPAVIATGGGAYMSPETRERCHEAGITVWLKADVPVMLERVRKKDNRPLLAGADPEARMRSLLAEREPVYALADITIASRDGPHHAVVSELIAALDAYLRKDGTS